LVLAVPGMAQADWSENFDSYALGSGLHGQGGWHTWDGTLSWDAYVSNVYSLSAPHSVSITGASDIVHEYSGYTSGVWMYTVWQYVPTGFSGISYFILLNTYNIGGPFNWSTQIAFNASTGTVISDMDNVSLPLITGQWVELRVKVDLLQNLQTVYYNGQTLTQVSWTEGLAPGGGALSIAAVDLFANTGSPIYYDNLSLVPAPIEPEGACCFTNGDCTITTEAGCTGTYWLVGRLCSPNPCDQPVLTGACCDEATGACTITTQAACQFHWLGANVPCNVVTCGPPVPVERASWGQIKNMYR
jgi:hypothetical protein